MGIHSGFSKLGRKEKLEILRNEIPLTNDQISVLNTLNNYNGGSNNAIEKLSENYISDFSLPFSIAPDFLINDRWYFIPMVTEESSVVAAASYSAKFWASNGGFRTKIIGTVKRGNIYFTWKGDNKKLINSFQSLKVIMADSVKTLIENMVKRGGGISEITLEAADNGARDYHKINVEFETADSMGANLINTCLETMTSALILFFKNNFSETGQEAEIIMSILSNYTPECMAECTVECNIDKFAPVSGRLSPEHFAKKFEKAVRIAAEDTSRAVTHNKGIFNGIDAALIATGNDFRAVEACAHAYASKNGRYSSLTDIDISDNRFRYTLRIPLALGTVGGASSVHPTARLALQILHNPSAGELMQIIVSVGLASNFSAIRSLITEGIQKGHMQLHLSNILHLYQATGKEKSAAEKHFRNKNYTVNAVSEYLKSLREK